LSAQAISCTLSFHLIRHNDLTLPQHAKPTTDMSQTSNNFTLRENLNIDTLGDEEMQIPASQRSGINLDPEGGPKAYRISTWSIRAVKEPELYKRVMKCTAVGHKTKTLAWVSEDDETITGFVCSHDSCCSYSVEMIEAKWTSVAPTAPHVSLSQGNSNAAHVAPADDKNTKLITAALENLNASQQKLTSEVNTVTNTVRETVQQLFELKEREQERNRQVTRETHSRENVRVDLVTPVTPPPDAKTTKSQYVSPNYKGRNPRNTQVESNSTVGPKRAVDRYVPTPDSQRSLPRVKASSPPPRRELQGEGLERLADKLGKQFLDMQERSFKRFEKLEQRLGTKKVAKPTKDFPRALPPTMMQPQPLSGNHWQPSPGPVYPRHHTEMHPYMRYDASPFGTPSFPVYPSNRRRRNGAARHPWGTPPGPYPQSYPY
jgi:hypothetical protein